MALPSDSFPSEPLEPVESLSPANRSAGPAVPVMDEEEGMRSFLSRTLNDEREDLLAYSVARNIDLALIEEMPLGDTGHDCNATHLSSDPAHDFTAAMDAPKILRFMSSTGG